ncbi:iron complex outermembrane recepter protein [Spirosomataceae bacterium TFI 002]|nr:iron complex outermembrane recepter protein [Spirosomataceae bacterium TFI 002]
MSNFCFDCRLMRRFTFIASAFLLLSISAIAQEDTTKIQALNEVVVNATRASVKSGMAFTTIGKQTIEKQNLGQDIPFLLNQTPSVVVTSDAGAGVGYTGIRIRGTDPTRINVTLNGVPFNDSESQGVFWVNMPDIASSVASIQIQRGVGTSTNGAGAFGASINVNTLQYEPEAYGEINTSYGSFNTFKTNVMASTGLMENHFVIDARLSKITSDGWVERASSDLKSFYLSGGYYKNDNFVRLNVFSGQERTYQSWYGVPESLANGDQAGIQSFVDRNYIDDKFKSRMLAAGRKFNWYDYENEVDNYQQDHYQLITSFKLGDHWRLNPTLHYTYGRGYYEQFKDGESYSDYGLEDIIIGSETISETDLVRRKWLDNHFYGGVWSLEYDPKTKVNVTIGGAMSRYEGEHFGEVVWSQFTPEGAKDHRWYENVGVKNDFNVYAKSIYQFNSKFNSFIDLQVRAVSLDINGTIDTRANTDVSTNFTFFNPKVGLNYDFSAKSSLYGSFAVGNKEPSRQDFVDNVANPPQHENLQDLELGFRFMEKDQLFEANFFHMNYKNQLVLTGNVNDVGEAIRVNVPKSFRTGLELQYGKNLGKMWKIAANGTISANKIVNFEETIVSYDSSPNIVNQFENTAISFSPDLIAGGVISFLPVSGLEFSILPKYVGKQYLDNTSNDARSLDAFFVNNLNVIYEFKSRGFKKTSLSLLVNNLFNVQYEPNGYTYSYNYEGTITENFVYPQAGINFLAALKIRF